MKFLVIYLSFINLVFANDICDQFKKSSKEYQCQAVQVGSKKEEEVLKSIFDLIQKENEYTDFDKKVQDANCKDTTTWPFGRCFKKFGINKTTGTITNPQAIACCQRFKSENKYATRKRVKQFKKKRDKIVKENVEFAATIPTLLTTVLNAKCLEINCDCDAPKEIKEDFIGNFFLSIKDKIKDQNLYKKEVENYCENRSQLNNSTNCALYVRSVAKRLDEISDHEQIDIFQNLVLPQCGIEPSFQNIGCLEFSERLVKYYHKDANKKLKSEKREETTELCLKEFMNRGESNKSCENIIKVFLETSASDSKIQYIGNEIFSIDFVRKFNYQCTYVDLYESSLQNIVQNQNFMTIKNPLNLADLETRINELCKGNPGLQEFMLCQDFDFIIKRLKTIDDTLVKANTVYKFCEKIMDNPINKESNIKKIRREFFRKCESILKWDNLSNRLKVKEGSVKEFYTTIDFKKENKEKFDPIIKSCNSFNEKYKELDKIDLEDVVSYQDQCKRFNEFLDDLDREKSRRDIELICASLQFPILTNDPAEDSQSLASNAQKEARSLIRENRKAYLDICNDLKSKVFMH